MPNKCKRKQSTLSSWMNRSERPITNQNIILTEANNSKNLNSTTLQNNSIVDSSPLLKKIRVESPDKNIVDNFTSCETLSCEDQPSGQFEYSNDIGHFLKHTHPSDYNKVRFLEF